MMVASVALAASLSLPLLLSVPLWPSLSPVWAAPGDGADGARAPVADAGRAEAAERFDHAMALLDEGDDAGALAELRRVYAIAPHPRVLYNIGLACAALGRPVEATEALDRVLAAPGTLPAGSLRRARDTREQQARRVARLEVTTNVPATIEIDGVEAGRTPLGGPLAVAAGTRLVAAQSAGYLPARKEIAIAGGVTEALGLELAPSELRLAHLTIRTAVPEADVLVDGERVGRTPLAGSLALPPGTRVIEIRRDGYRPARREVALGDGASGEATFDLDEQEDAGARASWGRLVLAVSEPDPDVFVDGKPRGAYAGPLWLSPGAHDVRVARAGFLSVDRRVTVPARSETAAKVTLVPTPETRAAYKERAEARRRWSWIGIAGGAALAVGATAALLWNRAPLAAADAHIAAIKIQEPCRRAFAMNTPSDECKTMLEAADATFNKHQTIQNIGLIALGLGVVAAGASVALRLTGDDPARYDRAPGERDAAGGVALGGWLAPGGGGGGLSFAGAF